MLSAGMKNVLLNNKRLLEKIWTLKINERQRCCRDAPVLTYWNQVRPSGCLATPNATQYRLFTFLSSWLLKCCVDGNHIEIVIK